MEYQPVKGARVLDIRWRAHGVAKVVTEGPEVCEVEWLSGPLPKREFIAIKYLEPVRKEKEPWE